MRSIQSMQSTNNNDPDQNQCGVSPPSKQENDEKNLKFGGFPRTRLEIICQLYTRQIQKIQDCLPGQSLVINEDQEFIANTSQANEGLTSKEVNQNLVTLTENTKTKKSLTHNH
jgi:hypothetical protein